MMLSKLVSLLRQAIRLFAVLLVAKIVCAVLLKYADYLPPNFNSDFLHGRDRYFWSSYHWAFYPHIFSGPLALTLGLLLMSDRLRFRWPHVHKYLGRLQAVNVLLFVVPSGLWMALYAEHGPHATFGFLFLSLATGLTIALGWRTALQRRFASHRRWMTRCFILLCSAVLVRVNGGYGELLGIQSHWYYAQAAWTTWIIPLALYQLYITIGTHSLFPRERATREQGSAHHLPNSVTSV